MATAKGLFHGHSIPLLLALASLALILGGCYPDHNQSTFDAAGPVAEMQRNLYYLIFWVAVLVFVAVEGILLYTVIRFRRRPSQEIPRQVHGNRNLEIAWTIAPALILVVIAVPTISTIFQTANVPSNEEVLEVQVTAHQWWWEFSYPDSGIVTANELHIPVGRVVKVTLQSADVIHSFWVPKLAGKMDMIPNNVNTMWFKAVRPGEYYGQCAEFCGFAHAMMRFRVIAEDANEFDAWVRDQKAPPVEPTDTLAKEGKLLFGQKGCTVCHTNTAIGPDQEGRLQAARMNAFLKGQPFYPSPNLAHFASRSTIAAGTLENAEDNLRRWLHDPDEVKPGTYMRSLAGAYNDPGLSLTDGDISALAAYLESLK